VFEWPSARHIYLSPHLDDVVLSCGGTLFQQARQGETIAVVTIFAGSPPPRPLSSFVEELHQRWQAAAPTVDLRDPPAVRRQEDLRALRRLSAAILPMHLPLSDCIYRTDSQGNALYDSRDQIFGEVSGEDPTRSTLETAGPPPPGTIVYAPLGVGHHVDHQIVHDWARGWGLPAQVRYYEDYPYAADEAALRTITENLHDWEQTCNTISERALAAKIEATACYETQISSFWENVEAMKVALTKQVQRSSGECFWREGSQLG